MLDKHGRSALHAVALGVGARLGVCAKLLLDHTGPPLLNINLPDLRGNSPLHAAAEMGQVGICKLMLRAKGVEKESRNALGETPLGTAARHNRIEILEALVLEGAYTEARGLDGRTPLGHAVSHPQPEGVRLLLESGADVNVRMLDGGNPLTVAAQSGNHRQLLLLKDAGADLNSVTDAGYEEAKRRSSYSVLRSIHALRRNRSTCIRRNEILSR